MVLNAFFLALREIRRNLMRSFLTVLGIVIGVAAVITMVTIGNGATAKVTGDIAKLGSNLLMVFPGQQRGPGGSSTGARSFDIHDVEAVKREIGSIRAVAPSNGQAVTAVYGNNNWGTTITGTDNSYFEVRDWTLESGRIFTDAELRSGKSVCVIGKTVAQELFGDSDPLGKSIRMKNISCIVIGVLDAKGQTGIGRDQDDTLIAPLRMVQRRIAGNTDIDLIQVSVRDGASTAAVQKQIEQLLRERRRILPSEFNDFRIRDMKEIEDTVAGATRVLTALLSAVAAVSLLVGGIGIMNIMLVSVTERTREIGTRLAIGALEREVMTQFLVEAVVLSSFGGIVGIILAFFSSMAMAGLLNVPLAFQPEIVIIAFLFSSMVGMVFGYFPARKAARLNPIDALRYE